MSEAVSALSTAEAQKLGDRLRTGLDFLNTLRGIDLTKLGDLLAAVKEVATADGIKGKVLAGLNAAKIYASMTASDGDDKLVEVIGNVIGNGDLIDFIAGLFEEWSKAGVAHTMSDESYVGEPVQAASINVALWIQIAKFVWALIQSSRAE